MSNIFSHIKIGPKIYAGFAVVLLLLLGTAANSWFRLSDLSDNVTTLDQVARRTTAVNLIQESVLLIRQKARDYVVGAPSATEDEPKVYAQGMTRVNDAMSLFNAQDAARLKGVGETFSEYHAYFNDFVKLDGQRQDLITNSLRPAAAKVEDSLQQIAKSANAAGSAGTLYLAATANNDFGKAMADTESYAAARYVAVPNNAAITAFRDAQAQAEKAVTALRIEVKEPAQQKLAAALPAEIQSYGKIFD